jgi:hypothetical protein
MAPSFVRTGSLGGINVRTKYRHCPVCHKRMSKFSEDAEGKRRFYYCVCGQRVTHFTDANASTDDWPPDVVESAVRRKLINRAGRVLSR